VATDETGGVQELSAVWGEFEDFGDLEIAKCLGKGFVEARSGGLGHDD
jgi:hypothetical protein